MPTLRRRCAASPSAITLTSLSRRTGVPSRTGRLGRGSRPAGHDRRRDRDALLEVDRTRYADAEAGEPLDALGGHQLAGGVQRVGEHCLGAATDVEGLVVAGEHLELPSAIATRIEVVSSSTPTKRNRGSRSTEPRTSSPSRLRRAAVDRQAQLHQPARLGRDGGPGHPEPAREVDPRERALVADVGEDLGLGRRLARPERMCTMRAWCHAANADQRQPSYMLSDESPCLSI